MEREPLRYDRDELTVRLARLPTRLRAAFAAACAERQIQNYERFLPNQVSEANILKLTLQKVWEDAEGNAVNPSELASLRDRCQSIIDDNDLDNTAPLPFDAAASVHCAVSARLTDDPDEAVWAAERANAAADGALIDKLNLSTIDRELDELINAHPVVQAELRRQQLDLQDLEAADSDDSVIATVVAKLRDRARRDAVNFLGDWAPDPEEIAIEHSVALDGQGRTVHRSIAWVVQGLRIARKSCRT